MATEQSNLKTWRLKIHSVKPETKPDKDGFLPMRIFGKSANAEYRLEYYDDHYSIHQLDMTNDGSPAHNQRDRNDNLVPRQSWFPIQEKEAQHLLNGNGLIVDELVLEIDE